MAATKQEAESAFRHFQNTWQPKYPQAAECLAKHREELLAFHDFPAEHWRHLRTTNPIESVCATVRLRTVKTRGWLSRKTAFAMVYRLVLSAQGKWLRLNGTESLPKVIEGVSFEDGIQVVRSSLAPSVKGDDRSPRGSILASSPSPSLIGRYSGSLAPGR